MLKHLNIDEMVALSEPWVRRPKRKAMFLSVPEIAALHPQVAAVHGQLLAARPAVNTMSPKLRAILDEETITDALHDHLARATSSGIDCHREHCLAEDPPNVAGAAMCDEAAAKILPNGLLIINNSLLAESGNAARLQKLLKDEPAVAAFLGGIPGTKKTTLLDTVNRWIAAGLKLGNLEHQREELEAKETSSPANKASVSALRNRWIRLVSLIVANLDMSSAPADVIEAIRGPVLRASDRAAKRYGDGGQGGNVVEPEPEGTDEQKPA